MKAYFSKCALNLSEEVIIRHLRSLVVYVVHRKTQFLYLLKVIVELKSTRKLWTQAVLYVLCSAKLHIQIYESLQQ